MTLNALALECIRAHKEFSGDADYVLTVEQWIKDALDELALETNWRAFVTNATITTANGTQVYTLNTLVRDIRYLRDPNTETKLEYVPKERLADLGLDLEHTGRPQFWYYSQPTVVANDPRYVIGLQPIPDGVYVLDAQFNIVPQDILSGGHIPILDDMILPLKFCTRAYMYEDDRNYDGADRMYQRFKNAVNLLMIRENNKYDYMPRFQMRDIPGRGADRRLARLDPNHFS